MAMVRARRAKNRPARVLIPLVLLLGVAVGVLGWRTNYTFDVASLLTAPSSSRSPGATVSASTSTAETAPPTSEAEDALRSCRTRVEAADAVIEAADTGVGHWAEHVGAQTKANQGEISGTMRDEVFKRTRAAGPEDQERYSEAREDYRATDDSCEPEVAAPEEIVAALTGCQERAEAQERVLRAAEPAMADWKDHLDQMKESDTKPMSDDQETWLKAWRAAPPNINAFTKALEDFEDDAPRCAEPQ